MLKVGLTGGIASGKSTVCKAFACLGAKVLDADAIARELVQPGKPAWGQLKELFPPEFFCRDGSLRRRRLREVVFSDPGARRQLNEIIHPQLMREIRQRSEQLVTGAAGAVVMVDAPLLLEVGASKYFDRVIVVFVPREIQIERLRRRDQLSLEQARASLAAQMPLERKVLEGDYLIDNSGSVEETKVQVERVWQDLLRLSRDAGTGKPRQQG